MKTCQQSISIANTEIAATCARMTSVSEMIASTPSAAKRWASNGVGGLRELSAPLRQRYSHPVTQKRIILFIVCLALLLDNMLYMVIVPIIDEYFEEPTSGTAAMNTTPYTSSTTPYESITYAQENATFNYKNESIFGEDESTSNPEARFHFIKNLEKKFKEIKIKPVKLHDSKDGMMGILFASKAIVQLCVNPFTGAFIDRVGYVKPLTMGLMVMFLSTSVFAGAQSYAWLFMARSLQGVGSALADTASFGLIADRFHNEAERSKALGIALAFISFGCLVAPPFGGILYEFVGRQVPFVVLAITCLFDASLLLLLENPSEDEESKTEQKKLVGTPIYKLLMDPYIMIVAGALSIANFPLAFLEPTIAEWMQNTMEASPWQIGLIWLPPFLPHVLGVITTVKLSAKYFRFQWLYGAIGLLFIGVSIMTVSFCKSVALLILPLSVMCFGIALIDTALLPTLAFLVDVRYTSVYGSVYAIADISYSVAYALGPVMAGQAVQYLGYAKMNLLIGLANLLFAPVLFALRKVYDWNSDRTERHMLLHNEVEFDGEMERTSHQKLNGAQKELAGSASDADAVDGKNNVPNGDPAVSHEEKICLRESEWKVPNYKSSDEQGNPPVSTSINQRPRPRPRRASRESQLSPNFSTNKYETALLSQNENESRKKF